LQTQQDAVWLQFAQVFVRAEAFDARLQVVNIDEIDGEVELREHFAALE
jgi:hypothetical protein